MSVHHDVKRFAQGLGEGEWEHGLRIRGHGAGYWAERGCGVACLRMILQSVAEARFLASFSGRVIRFDQPGVGALPSQGGPA